jgi:diaminopimelate decarboxylase
MPRSFASWTQRPSAEQIAAVTRQALAAGYLSDTAPALILHDLDLLQARLRQLHAAFPAGTLHAVAIKANPLVALLQTVVASGAGLEAASLEEVHLGLAAGCPPPRLVYDSPAKTVSDLAQALRLGIRINADNADEIARIAALRETIPSESVIGLRVNPLVGEGRIPITSVTGRSSRFGMAWHEDPTRLVDLFAQSPWLTGLHVHVGSQGCDLGLLTAAIRRAHELLVTINARLGHRQVTQLDIGGGLPTCYDGAHPEPPSLAGYVAALRQAVPALFDGSVHLVTEFGRSLHVNCGWAVSRVAYVKDVADGQVAVMHVGADCFLREAYHPQDWPHEFLLLTPDGQPQPATGLRPWTVAGPLCFAGDIIGRDVRLPTVAPDDLLVVRDVGAYTYSMWSRHCSRGMPTILGYAGSADPVFELLRERETAADLVAFWQPRRSSPRAVSPRRPSAGPFAGTGPAK